MSRVTYNAGNMTITVAGIKDVERRLGKLKSKAPAAMKFAINATARKTRKLMLAKAKARYAVNSKGEQHIDDLAQKRKAKNSSVLAVLQIASRDIDLAYFDHSPTQVFSGKEVLSRAPEVVRARVLKSSPMKSLDAGTRDTDDGPVEVGKGFLAKFASGHTGMVLRQIGSSSPNTRTSKGYPRWTSKDGNVELLQTAYAPSGPAMHNTIWPEVEPSAADILQEQLDRRVEMILAKAKKG